MPPKRTKKAAEESKREHEAEADPEGEDNPFSNQTSSQKRASDSFKCACGKHYGSLAAVHTHINNKHQDEKKKYKNLIYNPKKTGKGSSTSIRMKDIQFPPKEADLMCLADNTLKTIFDYMKGVYEAKSQQLLILEDE
jgi:hypothetical protein